MNTLDLKILDPRVGDTIPLPAYATPGSAAMDLRAVFAGDHYTVEPNATALIGTGLPPLATAPSSSPVPVWATNTAWCSATSPASSTATTRAN